MTLLDIALDHYRNHGARFLLGRAHNWILRQIRRKYVDFRIRNSPPLPAYKYTYQVAGQEFDFRITTQRELRRLREETEKPVHEDLLSSIAPSDVFFDIGANIGRYSVIAASEIEDGQIIAFEPVPANVDSLHRNLSLHSVNSSICQVALFDSDGGAEFELDAETAGAGMGRIAPNATAGRKSTSVKTKRADDLISSGDLPQPNVIKIDVEGAELRVLKGMESALSDQRCHTLYIEIHLPIDSRPEKESIADFDTTVEELQAFLSDNGFSTERLVERNTPILKGYVIKASK